jgi:hypothetical protein
MRQLTLLPLLFALCASIMFVTAHSAEGAIYSGCTSWDLVGRYAVPMVVGVPFFVAILVALPTIAYQQYRQRPVEQRRQNIVYRRTGVPAERFWLPVQAGLLTLLLVAFAAQTVAYAQADSQATFNVTGCVAVNPTNLGPIISYLQSENVHYVWGTGWAGDSITFDTNRDIIVTNSTGRILSDYQVLLAAQRVSIAFLASHTDAYPTLLKTLDGLGYTYKVKRFYTRDNTDYAIVTPLNKTLRPDDPALTGVWTTVFKGCL